MKCECGAKVLLPKRLTGGNGAKALLMGEFFETVRVDCPECFGEGCEACGHEGYEKIRVDISWQTIKEIYRKIVETYGE